MAAHIGIPQITPGEVPVQIEVRVLHKWRPYKDGTILSYLMVDKFGNRIQATFDVDEEVELDRLITITKCYILDRYICKHALTILKVTTHAASVKLSKDASIKEMEDDGTIPMYYFNFIPFDQLRSRVRVHRLLTDFIGKVEDLEHVETSANNSLLRLKLRDTSDNIIVVALWKEIASTVDIDSLASRDRPVITAITALKVVPYMGGIQMQSCSATRVYINPDIDLAKEMANRFRGTATPDKIRFTPKISERNRITLSALYEQDMKSLSENKFTCEATVTRLTKSRNWYYASCGQCNQTLYKQVEGYTCAQHQQNDLKYTYCFSCTIEDDAGLADVTLFEQAMTAMIGVSSFDMITKQGYSNAMQIPDPIQAIIGMKKIFQLKKSEKAFKNTLQFVVNRVFDIGSDTPASPSVGPDPATTARSYSDHPHAKRKLFNEAENDPNKKKAAE